jgi:hypothetical protein
MFIIVMRDGAQTTAVLNLQSTFLPSLCILRNYLPLCCFASSTAGWSGYTFFVKGTNSLTVLMCRKAVIQTNKSPPSLLFPLLPRIYYIFGWCIKNLTC